jgi:hypothetical protein
MTTPFKQVWYLDARIAPYNVKEEISDIWSSKEYPNGMSVSVDVEYLLYFAPYTGKYILSQKPDIPLDEVVLINYMW